MGFLKSLGIGRSFANAAMREVLLGIIASSSYLSRVPIWRKRKLQKAEHSAKAA